ncbi:MAG: hypothetical protein HY794_05195 [Desulfarculus sp.]|nr:hypothetical protein [Desulfarculus sp.]
MTPAREMLRRPAFQWVLFLLGLALCYWPFLVFGEQWPQPLAYYYLLAVWAFMVLALYLLSRALRPRLPRDNQRPGESPPAGQGGA